MRQPEPNRDSEAFLSALADEICRPPGEMTARRQAGAAAATARTARAARRAERLRLGAAAAAVVMLLGTGGVTAAGALPAPLQAVVADVARAMPVPIRVPYPTLVTQTRVDARSEADLPDPREGEQVVEPYEPITRTTIAGPAEQPIPPGEGDDFERDGEDREERDGDRCDIADRVDGRRHSDDEEVRALIREECDVDFVDPPRFDESERDEGSQRDRDRDDEHGADDGDGDDEERDSDSGHWGERDDDSGDREEGGPDD
jgi:hypothetical protein